MKLKNKKLSGFTLSELLISMGVIGVIAAITVPTLTANYQRRSLLLGLQKTYNEISQAVDLFILNDMHKTLYRSALSLRGEAMTNENLQNSAGAFLKRYFRIVQDCGTNTAPCFAASYKNIDGDAGEFNCPGYAVTLESSAALCLVPAEKDSVGKAAILYVDVNGNERPNIGGRDMFTFQIYNDGTIDESVNPGIKSGKFAGDPETIREGKFNDFCNTSFYGAGCFAKIINSNWKMDY